MEISSRELRIYRSGSWEGTLTVFLKRRCVDRAGDRSSCVDLFHHVLLPFEHPVLSNGRVREILDFAAGPSLIRVRVAGPADVDRFARVIPMRTSAFLALCRARFIRQAAFVRNIPRLLDELVQARGRTPVARTRDSRATVQYELARRNDVCPIGPTRDLKTIRERRHPTVQPARATVLRDVLVVHECQVALPRHVGPRELLGDVGRLHVRVRQR
mmetsp:Transcript_45725/g.76200  ORF Transcript_45725/g.76200 Transcript_45725/m.76200 type:complete len:215 (+) Transcript_45725:852-1496(+)